VSSPGQTGFAKQSVRGAAWLFGAGYFSFVVNFVVNLLIARLLDPQEFGIFAMAFAVIELAGVLAAFSVPLALIHLDESEPHLFDTGVWLYFGIAFLNLVAAVGAACLLPGGLLSEAGRILVVLGLSRVVLLMSQVSSAAIEKAFRYRTVSLIALATGAVPNFLALTLAWLGCGPWSLAAREVVMALLSWALLGAISPWRFRGGFDRGTARKIYAFCVRMFVSRGLSIVLDRADRLIVGAVSGAAALGLYDRSRYISEMGVTLTRPVDGLTFNLYSRLRDSEERLRNAYTALNYFLTRAMMGLSLVLFFYPTEIVLVLLGRTWLPAAPTLRWMAVYSGLLPLAYNLNQLLYGRGMMKDSNRAKLIQLLAFLPLFCFWLMRAGLPSAGFALFVGVAVGTAEMIRCQRSLLAPSLRELLAAPAAAAAAAALLLAALQGRRPPADTVPAALGALVVGGGLYAALLFLIERRRLFDRLHFVLTQLRGEEGTPEPPVDGRTDARIGSA